MNLFNYIASTSYLTTKTEVEEVYINRSRGSVHKPSYLLNMLNCGHVQKRTGVHQQYLLNSYETKPSIHTSPILTHHDTTERGVSVLL